MAIQAADESFQPATQGSESLTANGTIDGPRAWLRLYEIDDSFWETFVDEQPLAFDEWEKLFRLLYRLQRIPLTDVERWARGPARYQQLLEDPGKFRGELFHVEGEVTGIEAEPLAPELKERFEWSQLYRCRFVANDGSQSMVLVPNVPSHWLAAPEKHYKSAFYGLFVKRMRLESKNASELKDAAPENTTAETDTTNPETTKSDATGELLVFLAAHLAWYPDTPLGKLGMDVGLLDEVKDRRPLTAGERECFYQLLDAVDHASTKTLDAEARQELAQRRDKLTERLADLPPGSKTFRQTEATLEQAKTLRSSVVPLFNDPAAERGQLVLLEGNARRAVEVKVDDPDIVARFGIRHYFEVEIFTDDSQGNPLVCCVRELSPGMPRGENIHERVLVAGFFFKSWLYEAMSGKNTPSATNGQPGTRPALAQRLSPLVIGRQAQWIAPPSPWGTGLLGDVVTCTLLGLGCVLLFWAWRVSRGSRPASGAMATDQQTGSTPSSPNFDHLG